VAEKIQKVKINIMAKKKEKTSKEPKAKGGKKIKVKGLIFKGKWPKKDSKG
jgi:hypothetical protein